MEEQNLNINEIVVVEQLPKIMEQLDKLGLMVDEKLKGIENIQCTEENKQMVKDKRTEINNTLKALEDKRKEIKNAINEPYNVFNTKYEETTKVKLQNASQMLSDKINEIENAQKLVKEEELRDYFEEYRTLNHLEDIIEFEDCKLNITLSASIKSLKDSITSFCEKVSTDMKAITDSEDNIELLIEYKSCGFDLAKAMVNISEKHKRIAELQTKLSEVKEEIKVDEETIKVVDEFTTPTEVKQEETMSVTFTITDTKENIIKVREFMKENGIKYA